MLASDPVVAALIGLFAEAADYAPAFALEGERPEDAIDRVRPLFVVLLDATLDTANSDLFYARAARRRVGLAVFTRSAGERFPEGAVRRGIPCAPLPTDTSELDALLERAAASEWWERSERRRPPVVEPGTDGALVLVDDRGARWRVYDRRGSDRRRHGAADAPIERLFVGEGGETRVYQLAGDERTGRTASELARQLASAVPERDS